MSTTYYVAVHGGAGVHNRSYDHELKRSMKLACSAALRSFSQSVPAVGAVEKAICVLEDDEHLNAGYGSNLTLDETVECDAAIMDGLTGDFGSVGAVSGVKYPIRLAHAVLEHSRVPDPLGRIPPLTLTSEGARKFAGSKGVQVIPPESLIAPRAREEWRKWKERLDLAVRGHDCESADSLKELHHTQDTVGAVARDSSGRMAAGVSSGGLLLKHPGRVGEAALFGAGCWAQQSSSEDGVARGMACSVSGAGEHIVRAALARSLGEALGGEDDPDIHAILQHTLIDTFWKPCKDRGEPDPTAGILLLTKENDDERRAIPRLWCAFTTASMAIAYASSKDPSPKAVILRRPKRQSSSDGIPPIFITALPI